MHKHKLCNCTFVIITPVFSLMNICSHGVSLSFLNLQLVMLINVHFISYLQLFYIRYGTGKAHLKLEKKLSSKLTIFTSLPMWYYLLLMLKMISDNIKTTIQIL